MAEGKRTAYVVLRQSTIGSGDTERDEVWQVVGTFSVSGASQALRHAAEKLVADGESGGGTYTAVPARSWAPTKLEVETTTKLRWHGTREQTTSGAPSVE